MGTSLASQRYCRNNGDLFKVCGSGKVRAQYRKRRRWPLVAQLMAFTSSPAEGHGTALDQNRNYHLNNRHRLHAARTPSPTNTTTPRMMRNSSASFTCHSEPLNNDQRRRIREFQYAVDYRKACSTLLRTRAALGLGLLLRLAFGLRTPAGNPEHLPLGKSQRIDLAGRGLLFQKASAQQRQLLLGDAILAGQIKIDLDGDVLARLIGRDAPKRITAYIGALAESRERALGTPTSAPVVRVTFGRCSSRFRSRTYTTNRRRGRPSWRVSIRCHGMLEAPTQE